MIVQIALPGHWKMHRNRAPKNTPLQVWATNREPEATAAVHAAGLCRGVVNISA